MPKLAAERVIVSEKERYDVRSFIVSVAMVTKANVFQ